MSQGKSLMPFNVLVLVTFEVPRTWCGGRRYVAAHAELHFEQWKFVCQSDRMVSCHPFSMMTETELTFLPWYQCTHFNFSSYTHRYGLQSLPRSIQHLLIMPFAYIYHLTESLCTTPHTHTRHHLPILPVFFLFRLQFFGIFPNCYRDSVCGIRIAKIARYIWYVFALLSDHFVSRLWLQFYLVWIFFFSSFVCEFSVTMKSNVLW